MADRTINELTSALTGNLASTTKIPVWWSGASEAEVMSVGQLDNLIGAGSGTNWRAKVITDAAYGAVGDGVTDDSNAFKTAFDEGGVFLLPAGTYNWATMSQKTVSNSVTLVGLDPLNTTILLDSGNNLFVTNQFRCFNLKFNGNGDGTSTFISLNGLNSPVGEIEVDHCIFQDCNNAVRWGQVANIGANASVEQVKFRRCKVQGSLTSSFVNLKGGKVREIWVQDNYMAEGKLWFFHGGFIQNDGNTGPPGDKRRIICTGNIAKNIVQGSGTDQAGGIHCEAKQVIIIGNHLENIHVDSAVDMEAIYTKCKQAVIIGNVIKDNAATAAITLKGDGATGSSESKSQMNIVMGNTVEVDPSLVGAQWEDTSGIWMQTDHAIIANNMFKGLRTRLINDGGTGPRNMIHIHDNEFWECDVSEGIKFHNSADWRGIHIENNVFVDCDANNATFVIIDADGNNSYKGVRVSGNKQYGTAATGQTFCRMEAADGETLEDAKFHDNYMESVATGLRLVASTGTIDGIWVSENDFSNCTTAVSETGGNINNTLSNNNRGWAGF